VAGDCVPSQRQKVEMARWPAALEPWLGQEIRRKFTPPPWHPRCKDATLPESGLKIVGVTDGETLRRPRPDAPPIIRLEIRGMGASGDKSPKIYWLVNGRGIAQLPASQAFVHVLDKPGRIDITAMDDNGRFDRVSVSVR
ncbi:MAG: penicillin-binding protein 1C, partial [Betaproteobacteria bacterium]